MNYIDLFAGSGGMSLGFEKAGFKNVFSVENDENAAKTYKNNFKNNKIIIKDIKSITNREIKSLVGEKTIDLIIGGPPCQGFSMAGNVGRHFIDDKRNYLFKEYVRFVEVIEPKIFVMENVQRLATHNGGKTIKEILTEFEKINYKVKYKVLNSVNYDVPQYRSRIFIVGVNGNYDFDFPKGNDDYKTIYDAINDLPELKSGESSDIPNHEAMNHTEQMLLKMSFVSDGGNKTEIPEQYRPKSGDARKYIRYSSNKPSVTITGDMRKVFHYNQNRALTNRELARIQTFPDEFIFFGTKISIQQQIGNAVPPNLAYQIALEVKKSLKDN